MEERILVEKEKEQTLFICSDSVGETAEKVVKAALKQFQDKRVKVKRVRYIQSEEHIMDVIAEAEAGSSLIAYTLVQPELREMMKRESIRCGIRTVDIMGPMMQALIDTFQDDPLSKPGLMHQMDEDYFKRIEAVEFAVKYDDGKDAKGLLQADLVLIGISRTSKTPLSMYLAHKGFKVANLPLIPEVKVPPELFQLPEKKIYGLTMDAERNLIIRKERLKAMGLDMQAKYATFERIEEELSYAKSIFDQLECTVIDVTERAIEETAGLIIEDSQIEWRGRE